MNVLTFIYPLLFEVIKNTLNSQEELNQGISHNLFPGH